MPVNKHPSRHINPLRYPGGKRWFAPYLERLVNLNYIDPKLFVEPFAGGAGAALHLLSTDKVEAIGLSDIDPLISSFWKTVFFDTDWLLNEIENTEISLDEWHYQKWSTFDNTREQGFQCLFLNRTSYSGILAKKTGPIGGMKQQSNYKIDCRFNKKRIIEIIHNLGENYRDRVLFVWNKPWKYTVNEMARRIEKGRLDKKKILVYLDPPFIHKADSLYRHYFTMKDHIYLRDTLSQCDLPWILSYDDCDVSRDLYREVAHSSLDVLYCTDSAKKRSDANNKSELVVSNLKNTLSEIMPNSVNKKRNAVIRTNGSPYKNIKKDSLCQLNTRISRTGTR